MPSSPPQIPAEAIEALARSTWNVNGRLKGDPDWGPNYPHDRDTWIEEARRDLSAAYPHLLAAFKQNERLERVGQLVEDRAAVRARHFEEFKEALLSGEVIDEVADEWTEGEEGIAPSFVRSLIPGEHLDVAASIDIDEGVERG